MDIVESNAEIARLINRELESHFYSILNKHQRNIEDGVRRVVIDAIKAQPEYASLLRGRLMGEFGLTAASTKLEAILQVWSKNIVTRNQNKKFIIEAIQYDFRNVLALPEAQQLTAKGQSLSWLDWLLTQGDKTIIREYYVTFNANMQNSRTGQAVMARNRNKKWNVPPQYAGWVDNNWVTRAIDNIPDRVIENLLIGEVEKHW